MTPLLLAAVLVLGSVEPPSDAPPSDALKCASTTVLPGYGEGQPVIVMGDRVLPPTEGLDVLDKAEVGVIQIDCWDPEPGRFGARTGVVTVRVIPARHLETTLDRIETAAAAQRQIWNAGGPEETMVDPWPLRRMEVSSSTAGWELRIDTDFLSCTVDQDTDVGAARVPLRQGHMPRICTWRDEVQTQAMAQLAGHSDRDSIFEAARTELLSRLIIERVPMGPRTDLCLGLGGITTPVEDPSPAVVQAVTRRTAAYREERPGDSRVVPFSQCDLRWLEFNSEEGRRSMPVIVESLTLHDEGPYLIIFAHTGLSGENRLDCKMTIGPAGELTTEECGVWSQRFGAWRLKLPEGAGGG